jgi:hypothetical protein
MTKDSRRAGNEGDPSPSIQRATDWVVANRSNWVRGLLMLAFYFVFWLVKLMVSLIGLFQFGFLLLTRQPNAPLRSFGASLALYAHDIVAYLTCATERLPFPFTEWPRPAEGEGEDW